jgi:AcrR family transcriptional regulator
MRNGENTDAPRRRDRAGTEAAIVVAAQQLLSEHGFQTFGVNAVAKAAGCDKQLIYRYFGGLEGLADAIGAELAGWVNDNVPLPPPHGSYVDAIRHLVTHYADALSGSPLMVRILAWELAENNALIARLTKARSDALGRWIRVALSETPPPPAGVDAPAINALLIAAVQQMVISRSVSGRLAGMDLNDPEGGTRFMAAMIQVVERMYSER